MTVGRVAWAVGVFGTVTTFLLAVGADGIGAVFAFFQLGFLVGAPLAIVLQRELRSWPMVVVVSVPLSIALSAIAVQLLIWFRIATGELVVLTATAYGLALALLVAADGIGDAAVRSRSR